MTAMEVCESLGALKRFPSNNPRAVAMLAEIVDEHVPAERIEDLLRAMRRYDEWPGPATFETECRALSATGAANALPEFVGHPKPTDLCARCDSWGFVVVNGRYERCACTNGQVLDADWLDMLNRRTAIERGRSAADSTPGPITQSDIDLLLSEKRRA